VFAFYPPILNIENNEWRLKEATWAEFVVTNTQGGLEVAVPRRYIGPVSQIEKPIMILGLTRELEYKAGQVWPYEKRMFSMPAKAMTPPPRRAGETEPVQPKGANIITGISSSGTETRIGRMIMALLGSIAGLALMTVLVVKFTPVAKPTYVASDQEYLQLNKNDNYFAVVRKLGRPSEDHWRANSGELQYRALTFKQRGYTVILMGTDQDSAQYIGTMGMGRDGKEWSVLHYVEFDKGANTASMLRNLKKF
jgi:hypothetical protein